MVHQISHEADHAIHPPERSEVCYSELMSTVITVPTFADSALLLVVGFCGQLEYCKVAGYISHKEHDPNVISNQPITCLSDQQAGHMTCGPTIASKNSSQGLSRQLSNLQIRRVLQGNTLFYCVNTTYLVDRCICPASCRSRQMLKKTS